MNNAPTPMNETTPPDIMTLIPMQRIGGKVMVDKVEHTITDVTYSKNANETCITIRTERPRERMFS